MDSIWRIRFNDGCSTQEINFRAHCKVCARIRFEQQNRGCRVSVVIPGGGLNLHRASVQDLKERGGA